MGGTAIGGVKAKKANYERHGKDFYRRIGSLGGSTPTESPKGFAAMTREKRSAAGKKGGKISRRTYKKVQDDKATDK